VTQIVIEHDMKAIMRISDDIVVLNSGEKLMQGPPAKVVADPEVIAAYLGGASFG
jgi:branched-chain amino acid transport system ATP-binding protein